MISIHDCLQEHLAPHTEVTVQGWIKTKRDSKAGFAFISLHDGSCFHPIQILAAHTLPNYHTEISCLTSGCALTVTGQLVPSPAPGQAYEIHATTITVVGWVMNPASYPIQPKRHTLEYLREVAHLRMRTNTIGAVTRIRHRLAYAIHQFFDTLGFFWIATPIITTSDCEGAGELFRVSTLDLTHLPHTSSGHIDFSKDFFSQETFLTVSGQLNVEAYCLAMSKVYTFGPTFRAENSNTSRHLAEFWMIEPEVAFATLQDIATLAQQLLQHLAKNILQMASDDLDFFNQHVDRDCIARLEHLATTPFECIAYTEAIQLLQKASTSFTFPVQWGLDLQSEHERYLTEVIFKKPVIVTDYPEAIKSFYMKLNKDGKTVAAMDILVPGMGEIIGGSEREDQLDTLIARMKKAQLNLERYQWYLDLRRYGSVPHSGFGLGFERLINYITGLTNVRDVMPFPRTPGSAKF